METDNMVSFDRIMEHVEQAKLLHMKWVEIQDGFSAEAYNYYISKYYFEFFDRIPYTLYANYRNGIISKDEFLTELVFFFLTHDWK